MFMFGGNGRLYFVFGGPKRFGVGMGVTSYRKWTIEYMHEVLELN